MSKFHDVKESEKLVFEFNKPFYRCFDYSKVKHQGVLRSADYERVLIEFMIPESECRYDPYDIQCVTTAEYEASLGNLLISVMTNKTRFNQLEFDTNPVTKEANLDNMFLPIKNQLQEYVIEKTEVDREDNLLIALQDITNVEEELVQASIGTIWDRTFFNARKNTRLQIIFSVSHDVTVISRQVYNTFMLLGDIGGLSGLLYTVGASIASLLTHNSPENKLIEKLFVWRALTFGKA